MDGTNLSNTIVWIASAVIIAPLVYMGIKKWISMQKERKEALRIINAKKAYYNVLTREKMEKCPREDLGSAAVIHVLRKESEDYDNVYNNLNESEKVVYIIYEVLNSLKGKDATLRTFFEGDFYRPFFPMLDKAFYDLGCIELGDLMKAARRFNEIIENDLDDDEDDPELGDYSRYNFADFTNEFRTLVMSLKLNDRLTDFVENHKEDFIDEGMEDDCPELLL